MAVLASWLGLSLLVRAPHDRAARVFFWLCVNLSLYGLSSSLAPLTTSATVRHVFNLMLVVETVLLPPVFLHFILVTANVRTARVAQRAALLLFYAIALVMAGYALFSPDMVVSGDSLSYPPGIPTVVWMAQRVLPLLLSLGLVAVAYRDAGGNDLERRRRALFGIAALIAVSGAILAAIARGRFTLAPGHVLMDIGLAMMAYAVLAYRMLLPARVAQRAFLRSLLGSLLTVVYIGVLLVLEPATQRVLAVDVPLVSIFTIVVLVAAFQPLRDAVSGWLDRVFFHREFDYAQLLREVGDDLFEHGDLAGQLEVGLAAICRTVSISAGVVAVQEGTGLRVVAQSGAEESAVASDALRGVSTPSQPEYRFDDWPPWPAARLLLPLRRGDESLGLLALSSKRSGAPYTDVERVLLDSLGAYLALAIRHARNRQDEELALAALAEQSRQLQAEQELLAAQAAEVLSLAEMHEAAPAESSDPTGLRVFALGQLRVERDGVLIDHWGGEKAGTYQAEGLFAFLFDRRGRGVTKDEAEEIIWPDLAIDKADTAFHRTISALRRTLEPGLRRGNESRAITYHHERYWLDPATIAWCDTDAFVAAVDRGQALARQGNLEQASEQLRNGLALYRGEYLDDCPFYGDSAEVEGRRGDLRNQCVEALLVLGSLYERLGRVSEAATCYRRALNASHEECLPAEEALARLHLTV